MIGLVFGRPSTARSPGTRMAAVLPFGASAIVHAVALTLVAAVLIPPSPVSNRPAAQAGAPAAAAVPLPRLVFLAPQGGGPSGGGGGGGRREPLPIRRAEGVGRDRATLRTRPSVATTGVLAPPDARPLAVVLDARPLASGDSVQEGLPAGGVPFGGSLGPGSGGGVGSGTGTGIGSGSGPGVGPGTGGGTGGGPYRPGRGVTSPRLLFRTDPRYTTEALERRIQGTVSLEVVVTSTGLAGEVRVTHSLDPGLDAEAVRAIRQWRFAPGLLSGVAVDVVVVVVMDFRIH